MCNLKSILTAPFNGNAILNKRNTMLNILTFKLSPTLLKRLEKASQNAGLSKGKLIREALQNYLEGPTSDIDQLKNLTKSLLQNKKTSLKANWKEIRNKCSKRVAISPEEEVHKARRRNL